MKKESVILKLRSKAIIPVLECVYVRKGKATITDLKTYFTVSNDYEGEDKLTMPESYENFGAKECLGGYNFLDAGQYPPLKEFKPFGQIFLDEQNTLDLFAAMNFVGHDYIRPVMQGVSISEYVAATDAHKLYFSRINSFSRHRRKYHNFIIPVDAIKLLKVQKVKTCTIEYDKELKYIRFMDDNFEIITKLIDGKYPNFIDVVPTGKQKTFTVDKKEFLSALKRLAPLASSTGQVILYNNMADRLTISVENQDNNAKGLIAIDYKGSLEKVAFNISFLIKCVNTIKDTSIEVKYTESNRAFVLNGKLLIMPTMITD